MRSQETESRSLSMVRRAWVIEFFVTITLLQLRPVLELIRYTK